MLGGDPGLPLTRNGDTRGRDRVGEYGGGVFITAVGRVACARRFSTVRGLAPPPHFLTPYFPFRFFLRTRTEE